MYKLIKSYQIAILLMTAYFSASVIACPSEKSVLNEVNLFFSAEQWLTTTTALVNITINITVNEQNIDAIQTEVLNRLKSLANQAEWHILAMNRQLDQSGLESIQLTAQARLPQSRINVLRHATKSMSKPGETFTVNEINFIPSEKEQRQMDTQLRQKIYEQAQTEIMTLNQAYPKQQYFLHQINFQSTQLSSAGSSAASMPIAFKMLRSSNEGSQDNQAEKRINETSTAVPVSYKVILNANVVLATKIDPIIK